MIIQLNFSKIDWFSLCSANGSTDWPEFPLRCRILSHNSFGRLGLVLVVDLDAKVMDNADYKHSTLVHSKMGQVKCFLFKFLINVRI